MADRLILNSAATESTYTMFTSDIVSDILLMKAEMIRPKLHAATTQAGVLQLELDQLLIRMNHAHMRSMRYVYKMRVHIVERVLDIYRRYIAERWAEMQQLEYQLVDHGMDQAQAEHLVWVI